MQVLFCHDGPLTKYNNEYYGIAHNDELFERYKSIANRIGTVIRLNHTRNEDIMKSYSKITVSPFKVYEIPNIGSVKGILLHKKRAKKIIEDEIGRAHV